MSNHPNRSRISVDLGANWRLYTNLLPQRSKALGTVTRGEIDTGALVWLEAAGIYVQINAGSMRSLPQHKVQKAVDEARAGKRGGPGRGGGRTAADGAVNLERKQVSLDPQTIAVLSELGDGQLSLGIRKAAAHLHRGD